MAVARVLSLIGIAAAAASGAFLFQGCGSSSSPSGNPTGGVGAPPSPPNAPATTSTTEHNFAIKTLFLGDTTRAGDPSELAWRDYGYNLDGKVSDKTSTDVCQPPNNKNAVKQDGTNGIDNSFGDNVFPFITSIQTNAATLANQALADGTFTVMFDVTGLTDDAAQTNIGLTGFLNAGGKFSDTAKPKFTTADDWPVRPELLSDRSDPRSSTVRFPTAFVTNGLFVNGSQGDVTLSLVFAGQAIDLTIHKAIISFEHKGATADNGTIAGIVGTQELLDNLGHVAGNISTQFCTGTTLNDLLETIRNASDIMLDGSQTPGAECNGISIGLGFVAAEIGLPKTVGSAANGTDKCAAVDAGTGNNVDAATGDDASAD